MKKITLLFALLISSIGFSQQVVVEDFEGSPAIAGFEGLGSATIENDPASGGTRGKTFKLVTNSGGNAWQGAEVVLASGTVLDLTTDKTLKIDIYSTTAFAVMAKLEGSGPAAANTKSHGGSGWETITFTFTTGSDGTATANGEYTKVVFFPNRKADDTGWNSPVAAVTMYADNITGVKKTTAPPPGSQVVVEDFEGSPAIAGFEGLGSATIVDDPASGGTRGKTFQLITSSTGNGWQGAEVVLASGTVLELTTDKTIKVDIYSTTAFAVMAKLEGSGPAAANTQSHGGSGWETITFTFTTGSDGTATANGEYSKVVFFPNRKADDSGWNSPVAAVTMYADNITGVKKTVTPPPTDPVPPTAAPSPTNSDSAILSIYSDTGAFVGNSNVWTQNYDFGSNKGSIDLDGTNGVNNALKMDFSVAGYGAGTNAPVDITNYTHIHFDYYAPTLDAGANGHQVRFILIGEGQGEKNYELTPAGSDGTLVFDAWQQVDVPLSFFEGKGLTKDKFLQYKLGSASDLNTKIVYFDNIYFYNSATAGVEDNLFNVSIYPNPANNKLNISAVNTIQNAEIYNVLGKKVMNVAINKTSESIDISNLASGVYMIKYNIENNVGTAKFIKQ
ncbi:T9SS type A sorting domain-containing protein [Polaribacter sp.]|jgi:hypothetical protein|uniref:T9SS type A sorting domain-containing protein n=1 Tax=Polaribacter sp. TaxID=1920175 RepID=UPI0040472AE0